MPVLAIINWFLERVFRLLPFCTKHDEFAAVAVSRGDAFIVSRGRRQILVDAGETGDEAALEILKNRESAKIDILVCTHADSDHAGGVAKILNDNRIEVTEIWLPASWEIVYLLRKLDLTYNSILEEGSRVRAEQRSADSSNDNRELENLIVARLEETLAESFSESKVTERDAHDILELGKIVFSRIEDIIDSANSKDTKIRWFSYESWLNCFSPSGGESSLLVPVNSREVQSPSYSVNISGPGSVFLWNGLHQEFSSTSNVSRTAHLLYLTVSNRHSLVFWSPSTTNAPPVLFCSDWGCNASSPEYKNFKPDFIVPWNTKGQCIVTAPHHGSNDTQNRNVYGLIDTWHQHPDSIVWVRSDFSPTSTTSRPCIEFRKKKTRGCTDCYGRNRRKTLRFSGHEGSWEQTSWIECSNAKHCN